MSQSAVTTKDETISKLRGALEHLRAAGTLIQGISFDAPEGSPQYPLAHAAGQVIALVRGSNSANDPRLDDLIRSLMEGIPLGELAKVPIPREEDRSRLPLGDDEHSPTSGG